MSKYIKSNYLGESIVFIVASPRSGTTWLQRMLIASSHKIKTGPESFIFNHFIAPQVFQWHHNVIDGNHSLQYSLSRKEFILKLRAYTISLMEPMIAPLQTGDIYLEKSNSHALVLPIITEIFPKSKILFLLRDPRDVVASWLAATNSWAKNNHRYSASEFANHWKKTVLTVEEVKKSIPKNLFLELKYENLLNDTPKYLSETLNFLNIPVNNKRIDKVISDHAFANMKNGKGYQRILMKGDIGGSKGRFWEEPKGYFRKGKIGSWKKDLNILEKYQVYKETKTIMKTLGYL